MGIPEATFTNLDYVIVRNAVADLPKLHRAIVEMRFWRKATILEIAKTFRLTWKEVDQVIQQAMSLIKACCLSDPDFSRSTEESRTFLSAVHI